jgi:hypothetical protein
MATSAQARGGGGGHGGGHFGGIGGTDVGGIGRAHLGALDGSRQAPGRPSLRSLLASLRLWLLRMPALPALLRLLAILLLLIERMQKWRGAGGESMALSGLRSRQRHGPRYTPDPVPATKRTSGRLPCSCGGTNLDRARGGSGDDVRGRRRSCRNAIAFPEQSWLPITVGGRRRTPLRQPKAP